MADLVGVRAAAELLGVNPSTITRYLKKYEELNRAADGHKPLVDIGELAKHRKENINPSMKGSYKGALLEDEGAVLTPIRGKASDDTGASNVSYTKSKARREEANAQRAELDLAERLQTLVPLEEVQDACHAAGQILRDELANRRRELAERLVAMSDQREIEILLRNADEDLITKYESTMRNLGADEQADQVA